MLPIDHILPVAHGEGDETSNLTFVCAEHNHYVARLIMGDLIVDRHQSEARTH
jgi:hypothetical protein